MLSGDQPLLEPGLLCGLVGAEPVVALRSENGLAVRVVLDPGHSPLQVLP